MTALLALALGFPGFAVLALTMDRHRDQLLGRALSSRAALAGRCAGAGFLTLSLIVCSSRWNASVAVAVWAGVLTAASMGLGLLLTYAARSVLPLAALAATTGIVGWFALA
jgi:hypothetical protein